VVKANLLAAVLPETKGEVYNCASGVNVTINELAELIAVILERDDFEKKYDDWVPGDIKVFNIDNSKIRSSLNLEFLTNVVNGLEHTVHWAKDYFKRIS